MTHHRACCCGCQCSGSGHNVAVVTGLATCTTFATSENVPFSTFIENGTYCLWRWIKTVGFETIRVELFYFKKAGIAPFCGAVAAETWHIELYTVGFSGAEAWGSTTTGFSCDTDTGRMSGTQALTTASDICASVGGGFCTGDPTITVAA